jgi:tetratricopeptide (TPR) repeat protein
MYTDLSNIGDSVQQVKKTEEIKRFARRNKDRALELNVDFFLIFFSTFQQHQPRDVSLRKLKKQLEAATEEDIDFLKARSLRALAEFYWNLEGNYELAFEQYLLLDKELVAIKPGDYPEMARDLMQIGKAYYFFQDYKLAGEYFKRAIVLPETPFTTMVINDARNTLGLCYQQLNSLDSSDHYFKEVLKTTFPEAAVWKRIATGNLGTNMYLRQDYDRAIPLLEKDFYGSVAVNDYGCAAGASILLADIFRDKGELKQSAAFITYAKENIAKAEQPERLRLLYPVMSKWYVATGDTERSRQYMDSSMTALNRFNARFSALKVLRAQQRVDRQNQELQVAGYTLERQQKKAERNLLVLLVLILCIVIVLTYFIQKKRQLANDLKLQAASQELKIAALDLDRFTESIREKNNLIEQLESRNPEPEKTGIFRELRESTILTEDDWIAFQRLFDQAYPGFIQRARQAYPDLTTSELRYFALSRIAISAKEIAAMLGVSPNTIQVMRHRIRKKLGFADNQVMEVEINRI